LPTARVMAEQHDVSVANRCPESAGITLLTKQGKRLSGFIERSADIPHNSISNQDLIDKFVGCINRTGLDDASGQQLATDLHAVDQPEERSAFFRDRHFGAVL